MRYFVAIKMSRRQGARTGLADGAYLNRYVSDEQRSRRPIFIVTLCAGTKHLVFRGRTPGLFVLWVLECALR
jgi:hypothetical protein